MKHPNEMVLASLLAQINECRTSISIHEYMEWPIPIVLQNRLTELESALDIHRKMMAEDERKESQR
jgi:hypothetical protein